MLLKVLKYDFKSVGKKLLILYLITFILCAMTRIIYIPSDSNNIFAVVSYITNLFGIVSAIALVFMTFSNCLNRFYNNLFKEEGYLTNMLPVNINTHILSKYITSAVFCFITIIVVSVSLYIMYYSLDLVEGISRILKPISEMLIPFMFLLIMSYLSYLLLACASYSIGQLNHNNKILSSVVAGVVIYAVTQMVSLVILYVLTKINPDSINLLESNDVESIKTLVYLMSGVMIFYNIAYYFITIFALKKRMDLE